MMKFTKNISSSLFQYSEKTIASTETTGTSKERSDTKLLGAGKSEGVALSGGLQAYYATKRHWTKKNLMDLKYMKIVPLLFMYYKESLALSNLNSKKSRFHCVRPNF